MYFPYQLRGLNLAILIVILLLHFWIKPRYYSSEKHTSKDFFESESFGCFFSFMFVVAAGLGIGLAFYDENHQHKIIEGYIQNWLSFIITIIGFVFYLIVSPIKPNK